MHDKPVGEFCEKAAHEGAGSASGVQFADLSGIAREKASIPVYVRKGGGGAVRLLPRSFHTAEIPFRE